MGSKCEICDVVDDGVPNTGTAVTTDNINLVGKPVSWALENCPKEIEVPFIGGESGFLGFVSRNSPGFNSASVIHDKGVGFLERALGFEGTLFGTVFTVGSIPAAFGLQYTALGGHSYEYYIHNIEGR